MKKENFLIVTILLFGLNILTVTGTSDDINQETPILTGNYWDRGVDTNGDGKFDQLNKTLQI